MLENTDYILDTLGKSGAKIHIYDDKIIKIDEDSFQSSNEYYALKWLQNKVPVPKIIDRTILDGKSYLTISKLKGSNVTSLYYKKYPIKTIKALAKSLKLLWSIDIKNCPLPRMLLQNFQEAQYRITQNLIDVNEVEPETFGENGFASPQALLDWLIENRPNEDLVLSHGDFTFANIILDKFELSGFIDLGKCGLTDKWSDISLCCRDIAHYFGNQYIDLFLKELNVAYDSTKMKYYKLLDELF